MADPPITKSLPLRRYFSSGFSTLQAADSYRSSRSDSDTSGSAEVITIPVQVTLNDHVVGESVTTYQKKQRRANGR